MQVGIAAARALMPVMSDIHMPLLQYPPKALLLMFKFVNAPLVRGIAMWIGIADSDVDSNSEER